MPFQSSCILLLPIDAVSSIDDLGSGVDRTPTAMGPTAESASSLKTDLPRELVLVFGNNIHLIYITKEIKSNLFKITFGGLRAANDLVVNQRPSSPHQNL